LQADDINHESGDKDYRINRKEEITHANKTIILTCLGGLMIFTNQI
jgi:hypothetical protein